METNPNLPDDKSPEVSDEARQEATSRMRTLAPLHADIASNELPDDVIVNQNILQGPIANVSNDSESTTAYVSQGNQAKAAKSTGPALAIIGLIVVLAACTAAMIFFIK